MPGYSSGPVRRRKRHNDVQQSLKRDHIPRATSEKSDSEHRYNLLSCLAAAQACGIDFAGFSWVEAQGDLGEGGQAIVCQTRASVDVVLAFKRRSLPGGQRGTPIPKGKVDNAFRELTSEIWVLGQLAAQKHPNIVQLHAICWEILMSSSQELQKTELNSHLQVWPVLVFEKAPYGNLEVFMREDGRDLAISERLEICKHIASALGALHKNDVIHGDVKPRNVLVFGEDIHKVTAKLADFGGSTTASTKQIRLLQSHPWRAPELELSKSYYSLEEAKKTDVYSFGMLCFWVLFWERLEKMGTLAEPGGFITRTWSAMYSVIRNALGGEKLSLDIESLRNLNKASPDENKTLKYAIELVQSIDDEHQSRLLKLFKQTLAFDPSDRAGVGDIMDDLGCQRLSHQVAECNNSVISATRIPLPSQFKVTESIEELCQADYRVRSHILHCLSTELQEVKDPAEKTEIDFQLAFCAKIGFGTQEYTGDATNDSVVERVDISLEIPISQPGIMQTNRPTKKDPEPSLIKRLHSTGVIQPVHYVPEYNNAQRPDQQRIKNILQREIKNMERALGKNHPAVLTLKWSYGAALPGLIGIQSPEFNELLEKDLNSTEASKTRTESKDTTELIDHWSQMARDLENDITFGPKSIETLITKAYLAVSKMQMQNIETLDDVQVLAKEVYDEMNQSGLGDHVVTLMLCKLLAQNADFRGHTGEAAELYERMREWNKKIFGTDHPNSFALVDVETSLLMRLGKFSEAEGVLRDTIQRVGKLIGEEDMYLIHLLDLQFMALVAQQKYSEARKVIERMESLIPKNLPAWHPMRQPPRLMSIDILMDEERYAEAADECSKLITEAENAFLFLRRGSLPSLKAAIDQTGSPRAAVTMHLYSLHLMRSTALQLSGNPNASAEILKLLNIIHTSLHSSPWKQVDQASGLAGSALHAAMEAELVAVVEFLVTLATGNEQGETYEAVLAVAKKEGFHNEVAILEEYRTLCFTDPKEGLFGNRDLLKEFVKGKWEGSYLYANGGPRMDSKGRRTLEFHKVIESENEPEVVFIEGTAMDDQGEWFIRGEAETSGRLELVFWLKKGMMESGWEYAGVMNVEGRGMGGLWGPRGIVKKQKKGSQGSFFYYKV